MKRLYLTVEGQTEAAFATRVLGPHLQNFSVFLFKPRFTGMNRRRRGRIPKGGMRNTIKHMVSDIVNWLKEDQSHDARFSMMVDLYSLPSDFPGYLASMAMRSGREQARALQDKLAAEISDMRFVPYLQVHEYEALVLADPRRISSVYDVPESLIDDLCRECDGFLSPEDINHGVHSHPKYRIQQKVPDYDENIAGPLIAEDIGLSVLRERCPHFGEWLATLESLDTEGK